MKGLCLGWTVALACAVAVPVTASAQEIDPAETEGEPAEERPDVSERDDEARGLFLAGSAAFERGHFEEALDYFQRAYDLSRRAGLLFNIGHTAERLRRDELALESFERYLAEEPEADNRAQVERRIELLREAVDNREQDAAAPVPSPVTPTDEPVEDEHTPVGPVVTMAMGGAAVAGGIVLLALASSAASEVEDAPDGTPWTEVSDDHDAAGALGIAGGITLGLGAAALAVGLGWLIAGGSEGDGEPQADYAVRVGPSGIDVSGRF